MYPSSFCCSHDSAQLRLNLEPNFALRQSQGEQVFTGFNTFDYFIKPTLSRINCQQSSYERFIYFCCSTIKTTRIEHDINADSLTSS